jgi:hypothetical protein
MGVLVPVTSVPNRSPRSANDKKSLPQELVAGSSFYDSLAGPKEPGSACSIRLKVLSR